MKSKKLIINCLIASLTMSACNSNVGGGGNNTPQNQGNMHSALIAQNATNKLNNDYGDINYIDYRRDVLEANDILIFGDDAQRIIYFSASKGIQVWNGSDAHIPQNIVIDDKAFAEFIKNNLNKFTTVQSLLPDNSNAIYYDKDHNAIHWLAYEGNQWNELALDVTESDIKVKTLQSKQILLKNNDGNKRLSFKYSGIKDGIIIDVMYPTTDLPVNEDGETQEVLADEGYIAKAGFNAPNKTTILLSGSNTNNNTPESVYTSVKSSSPYVMTGAISKAEIAFINWLTDGKGTVVGDKPDVQSNIWDKLTSNPSIWIITTLALLSSGWHFLKVDKDTITKSQEDIKKKMESWKDNHLKLSKEIAEIRSEPLENEDVVQPDLKNIPKGTFLDNIKYTSVDGQLFLKNFGISLFGNEFELDHDLKIILKSDPDLLTNLGVRFEISDKGFIIKKLEFPISVKNVISIDNKGDSKAGDLVVGSVDRYDRQKVWIRNSSNILIEIFSINNKDTFVDKNEDIKSQAKDVLINLSRYKRAFMQANDLLETTDWNLLSSNDKKFHQEALKGEIIKSANQWMNNQLTKNAEFTINNNQNIEPSVKLFIKRKYLNSYEDLSQIKSEEDFKKLGLSENFTFKEFQQDIRNAQLVLGDKNTWWKSKTVAVGATAYGLSWAGIEWLRSSVGCGNYFCNTVELESDYDTSSSHTKYLVSDIVIKSIPYTNESQVKSAEFAQSFSMSCEELRNKIKTADGTPIPPNSGVYARYDGKNIPFSDINGNVCPVGSITKEEFAK